MELLSENMPSRVSQPADPVGKIVYLCGPIDSVTVEEGTTWRSEAQNRLTYHGFATFNPATAFRVGRILPDQISSMGRTIEKINRLAIAHCYALLVHVQPGQEAVGTWREVEYAREMRKPIYVVAPHLRHHAALWDVQVHDTLFDAVRALKTDHTEHKEGDGSVNLDIPDIGIVRVRPISRREQQEILGESI